MDMFSDDGSDKGGNDRADPTWDPVVPLKQGSVRVLQADPDNDCSEHEDVPAIPTHRGQFQMKLNRVVSLDDSIPPCHAALAVETIMHQSTAGYFVFKLGLGYISGLLSDAFGLGNEVSECLMHSADLLKIICLCKGTDQTVTKSRQT